MARLTKAQQAEQDEARDRLRELFPAGSTVHTVLRHVSQSGMSRSISVLAIDEDGPRDVSYLVARALGDRVDQHRGGVKVTGCGMDMGFHLVYALSSVLYRDGYTCTGDRCPSNTHVNPGPDRDARGPGVVHTDGYALSQRWV